MQTRAFYDTYNNNKDEGRLKSAIWQAERRKNKSGAKCDLWFVS